MDDRRMSHVDGVSGRGKYAWRRKLGIGAVAHRRKFWGGVGGRGLRLRYRGWAVAWLIASGALVAGCKDDEPVPARLAPAPQQPQQPQPGVDSADALSETVDKLRDPKPKKYRPASKEESAQYRQWLSHMLDSAGDGKLPTQLAPDGFVAHFADSGRVWILAEDPNQRRGAGAALLHPSPSNDVVIECPHTFFDEGTLQIGLTLFEALNARALLINTMHRGGNGSPEERLKHALSGEAETDLAHNTDTFFQAAHVELSERFAGASVIQLHGYRDEKVPSAKFIVSAAGTSAKTEPLSRALNAAFGAGAARNYPSEVKQLGGTTNAQASFSKDAGRHFLHVEIAASLRDQLRRQKSLRLRFAQAVSESLEP